MATREKFNYYAALSDSTLRELTSRRGDWRHFLDTAARLYKYSFQDQVMIYAQRPEATACAEIELWNERFNRWVRRGSKGIALIDDSGSYPDLKYVFDVSDTEPSRYNARPVRLWEMTAEHKPLVLAEFAKNYEDVGDSLVETFRSIAKQLAEEYYSDNTREILYQAENSLLEPPDAYLSDTPIEMVDDSALRKAFVEVLGASVAYSAMTRCGLDTSEYFGDDDFDRIWEFNTPAMANAIGAATADLSEQVLRDVELTIRKYERVKAAQRAQNAERSEENYDRNPYLQPSGRLSAPQHQTERAAEGGHAPAGQVRQNEESVPQRVSQDNVQQDAAERDAVPASAGNRRTGDDAVRDGDGRADQEDEPARQGGGSVGLDGGDERAESPGGGNGGERADLRGLDTAPAEAANEAVSAFSVSDAAEPTRYRYYSTQRPVSVGTYPQDSGRPVEIFNFDERTLVENGAFSAWGWLEYDNPLTAKQTEDYELRAGAEREQAKAQAVQSDSQTGENSDAPPPGQPPLTFSQLGTTSIEQILSTSAVTIAEVDSILRDGGNSNNSVHRIAARFAKAKTPEEMTAYLRREYLQGRYDRAERGSGKGFDFGNHSVCAWFDKDGISLAIGTTAKNNMHRATIPWEAAAERVRRLMSEGNYVDRAAFDAALENERYELAERLWDFYRDDMHEIPKEWQAEKGGHPEDVALINGFLSDSEERRMILEHLEEDVASFRSGGGRSWRNPERLLADMREFVLPPSIFPGGEYQYKRDFSRFITQDEIDEYLMSRGGDTKFNILSAYLTGNGDKDFTDFLKHGYGLGGGGTWSDGNGWSDYSPSGGIELKRGGTIFDPETNVKLNWNRAAKRVKDLIESGLYMTRAELDGITGYERLTLVKSINRFYGGLPQEYERPFPGENGFWHNEYKDENGETTLNFHYPHEAEWEAIHGLLDDNERVDALLTQMRYIFENTSEDDRHYNSRKSATEALAAFQAGTYTLFPGIENLPDPEAQITTRFNGNWRETVIDLNNSLPGDTPFAVPSAPAVQMSMFEIVNESPLPILPSAEEQRATIDDALKQEAREIENRENEPFLDISDADKSRLAEQFADNPRSRAAVELVKEIYGDSLNMPLSLMVRRIAELVAEGKFNTQTPYSFFERMRGELSARGFAVSDELIEYGLSDYNARGGKGGFRDIADFIESEHLTKEPGLASQTEVSETRQEPTIHRLASLFEGTETEINGVRMTFSGTDGKSVFYRETDGGDISGEVKETSIYDLAQAGYCFDNSGHNATVIGGGITIFDARRINAPQIYGYITNERSEDWYVDRDGNWLNKTEWQKEKERGALQSETIAKSEPAAEDDTEPETIPEPAPPPDFEAIAQTIYDRVLADDNFAYHLQFAQSRSSLRNPLNAALEKAIGELKDESDAYADYFNDDITDDLFDRVYKTAWENRPQPEAQAVPPIMAIDQAARQNYNLFALTFPRIIDGTHQAESYKDESNRTLTVWHDNTNAGLIHAEVAYYQPDGTRVCDPTVSATANFERRLLVAGNYANTRTGEDIALLSLPAGTEEEKTALALKLAEFISDVRSQVWTLSQSEVFHDADGNELPAEPKANLPEFLADRANREADAQFRAQQSESAPVSEPKQPRYEVRPVTIVEQITSDPPVAGLLEPSDSGGRYGVWDNETDRYIKNADETYVAFRTEAQAQAFIDRLTKGENFRITDDRLGEGGAKAKFRGNINAIGVIKDLELEKRNATPEEQEILSRYVGWGGLPQAFDKDNKQWENEYLELSAALTPEEFESARASTLNAHYTSPLVIKAIWETVERLGFTSGNVLEPSVGVGNFFGLIPDSMRRSKLYGVELDEMTAKIAQRLYPNADIRHKGFEKTDFSDSFFDIAVGNVPFGDYGVADKRYDKHNFSIHNYFFAKALDKVRPGGVMAFVTSKFTMDEHNPKVRKYLAERAEFLGAVRLPNTAFLKNAGTETTMDILFLQKRDRPLDTEPEWVHLGLSEDGIPCNRYFLGNPEMLCGVMGLDEHMNNKYGRDDMTACLPIDGDDLGDRLRAALSLVRGEIKLEELDDLEGVDNHAIAADANVKNFSYSLVNDAVYFRENSLMYPVDLPAATLDRIKGMIGLRDCVHALIEFQLDDFSDFAIERQQAKLGALYDSFSREFGLINSTANNRAFNADSAYYLLASLEILGEDGELERKADMFTKRTIKQSAVVTHVDTATEALAVAIGEKALVDLDYMSELTGFSREKLLDDLTGVVFLNVGSADSQEKAYVTADEYLSGNVRKKLELAEAAALTLPELQVNADALRAVQPKDLEAGEIAVRLGATWIDPAYVQQFMYELLDTSYYNKSVYQVKYHEITGEWQVTGKGKSQYSDIAATVTYGTGRMNAYRIIDDTLNLRDVRVYDYVEDADGKEKRVLNKKETMLAQQKQELIKQAFKDWIWKEPERRQTLTKLYNERFNSIRTREYDGSHLVLKGLASELNGRPLVLYDYQKNAIARQLYGGNTLLAHVVGAGKTFEMVCAAMESKRLGLCHKSLFSVPNHLTEQWAGEFLRLYPSANILVATKKDFEMRNRKKFCARIATGDYDAVIIGHSQLEKIPMSKERQERLMREQLWEIEAGIRELKENRGERFSIKQLEKTKRNLEVKLSKLLDAKQKDDVVTFEQLGVDRLFVDEAHNFKNLFLYTKMRNVAGLSTSEAQKSSDLFMKCRYLDELTEGKGVIFATGTPVSNSMTELYTLQRYLQYDALAAKNLTHFDAWASIFGETQTSIELAPEGTGYRARTRFAKFYNLPELMTMFRDVADIKTADMLNLPVPVARYENVIVEPSELQKEMVEELSERAARVHAKKVEPNEDNMLKIVRCKTQKCILSAGERYWR
jgi:N12 class adenine-specific DNA methylase